MQERKLGDFTVSAIGLGCMNLSHAYGMPPERGEAEALLRRALDLGYTHFDTATMYGAGANEELVGATLGTDRDKFTLASKCGLYPGADGKRDIDGDPRRIKKACEESLKRLNTEVIDLYYLHRLDRRVPIEESVGAFSDLIREGKIRSYGLSEMSAQTIRRAHKEHPMAALQTEYSLWTRNPEIAVLEACEELNITFVAFSPLARGYLSGTIGMDELDRLAPRDLRRNMPRFFPHNYARNLDLLSELRAVAEELGATMAEVALAWVLAKSPSIVAIPGTTDLDHLEQNARAADRVLTPEMMVRLEAAINQNTVHGQRYNESQQPDIDTEEFS